MPDYVGDAVDDMIARVSGDDDIGDDEMGYDVGYDVGAAPRRGRRRPGKRHQLAAMGSPVLARSEREMWKRAPLGLGNYSLATTVSGTFTGTIQRPFQPDRLLVTSSQLGILITSIKVGDEEQVLNGSVPAELYGVNALTDSLPDNFTAGATAITFSVSLSNSAGTTTTGAIGFKGAVRR